MPKNLFYTDGKTLKGIDLPQYKDSAWEWITDKPDTGKDVLYNSVSAVFRTANLTADAIGALPFALVDSAGNDYDNSDNWQNKVGFLRNPRELLRLWRLSLFMTNTAYGFMEGNKVIKNLRYIVPTTISPIVSNREGLTGFKRRVGSESTEYSLDDRRVFYMWRMDHTTELLPSVNTEFKALMAAAGVLFYSDYYVQSFFQRGGIKPHMLMVKGIPNPQDREKIEKIWDKVIHGFTDNLGKIFNADAIEAKPIGEGIENLKDSALHQDKLADVAMAAGMPLSLLMANSANFATARVEYMTWFRDSIIPWANYMADCMNVQLFEPMNLHFEFRPELSDHGQEEEVERATAYRNYVESGMKPSMAAQVVGIDLPAGVEFEQLDEDYAEMKPAVPQQFQADNLPKPIESPMADDDALEPPEMPTKSEPTVLTIEQLRELELWQSFALRKLKQGKSLNFPFVCKVVPEDIAARIRERLPECKDEQHIIDAFELTPREDDSIKMLAEALNRAAQLLEVN